MSVWEFLACRDGWANAHGSGDAEQADPMDLDRMRAIGIEGM